MMEFAGWEMPLFYRGAAEEHRAVRERCGIFDVSHMGEVELHGPQAGAVCQELTVNDVARLRIGDGQYTLLCNDRGGVLDDLIIFRLGPERYLMIVNAAGTDADVAWVVKLGKGGFVGRAMLAAQAERGIARRLVGLVLDEPGVPRHGCTVWRDGTRVGEVTSGTKSPTLGRYIGLAYVATAAAAPG